MKTGEPLPVGHLLDGRYRIHKLLGLGGMGRVYLANDTRLSSRPVAVKEMLVGDGAQERKAVEDFHREASVLARLSHPSIPQVIDYFDERERHYLVMEYVAGGDLQGRLDELGAGTRMSEATVLAMARQLLEVLQFLHGQKPPIIYRDLKPGNIMIDHHGRAMLIDFGIARFLPPGGRGTQIGSVGYAPPEQYLGKMEPRSDLYALAATMHHLLTGRDPQLEPPFSFPQITQLAPEVSAQTAHVVMAALDKEIGRRPASALVMKDLLPKPAKDEVSVSGAPASSGSKLKPQILTAATVVLDRPTSVSGSSTPRSLGKRSSIPTPIIKPVTPPPAAPPTPVSALPKSQSAMAQSQPRTRIATRSGLPGPVAHSLTVSSTSKTADLGLKKPPGPASGPVQPAGAEASKVRSRVAAAFASMRTAIAAGPVTTAASPALARNGMGEATPKLISPKSGSGRSPGPSAIKRTNTGVEALPAGAYLVSLAEGVQFLLSDGRHVLGRADPNGHGADIDLSKLRRGFERISRRHAEILKQGNDFFVRDLGSINGTYIAGRGRLGRDQLYKLKDRDELVLGSAKLEFRRS